MRDSSPPPIPVHEILDRLRRIIPPELDPRRFATRELAARTIFVMLYGGAVEGADRWLRPSAVTDMTDEQAALLEIDERFGWLDRGQGSSRPRVGRNRWYSENTREPIRDETIRHLIQLGAIVERPNVPTSSPRPRYALSSGFAALFAAALAGEELDVAIDGWQRRQLTKEELARLTLSRRGLRRSDDRPLVVLPNGVTRQLAPGRSSRLTKEVVEEFGPRFLRQPAVIVISESANKLTYSDGELARAIGLNIDPGRSLPDLVLADLAEPLLLVFVECVITDGEVSDRRRIELEQLARRAGFDPAACAYVTAFPDRVGSRFRTLSSSLAWGSFAWFASQPDNLIQLFAPGDPDVAAPLAVFLALGRSKT